MNMKFEALTMFESQTGRPLERAAGRGSSSAIAKERKQALPSLDCGHWLQIDAEPLPADFLFEEGDDGSEDASCPSGAGASAGAGSAPSSACAVRGASCNRPVRTNHSSVEKQRRQRVNTLIDALAEQVPSTDATPSAPGAKRPKHTVLADTLGLLQRMRQVIKDYEAQVAALAADRSVTPSGQASPQAPPCAGTGGVQDWMAQAFGCPAAAAHYGNDAESAHPSAASPCTASPYVAVPAGPAASPTPDADVSVQEPWTGQFHVRVCCPHRLDLRSDLADVLNTLPVQLDQLTFSDVNWHGMVQVDLQMHSLPGRFVDAEQLHLITYMAACCSFQADEQVLCQGHDAAAAQQADEGLWQAGAGSKRMRTM